MVERCQDKYWREDGYALGIILLEMLVGRNIAVEK
jgi:hypothetical protein